MCSVFEFLACEEMNGTTNLAVVDLSPCGFVFKEFWLQASILIEFLSCLFFLYISLQNVLHILAIVLPQWVVTAIKRIIAPLERPCSTLI